MSSPTGSAVTRELARALTLALETALAPGASAGAMRSAIDTAQVLGLVDLERLLDGLSADPDRSWPPAAAPAVERLRALAAECATAGTLEPIRRAADELQSLTRSLAALQGTRDSGSAETEEPVATMSLAEVLKEVPLADDASRARAGRVRVTAPVAAALRAALDWLEKEAPAPRPLRISAEASVVDVVCTHINPTGLKAAEKVLSVVGGVVCPASVIGPSAGPPGSWIVRVPSVAGQKSHLMLVQGELSIALPWHSVLRFTMVPSVELDSGVGGLGAPVLEPMSTLSRAYGERPVALIGHGLKRAYLVADRMVWRMEADPCAPDADLPRPELSRAVTTEDGDVYWLLDIAKALAPFDPPVIAMAAAPASPATPITPTTEPPSAEAPTGASPADVRTTIAAPITAAAEPALAVLGREDVEPLEALSPPAPIVELPSAAPRFELVTEAPPTPVIVESVEPAVIEALPTAQPEPQRTPEPVRAAGPPRALIAEDSIAARVFLTRMLEREGFAVRAVTTATELFDELLDETWSLLMVDIELPDRRQEDVFEKVVATTRGRETRVPVVALVRDAADQTKARAAGVTLSLRKPFDRDALAVLLGILGFGPRSES